MACTIRQWRRRPAARGRPGGARMRRGWAVCAAAAALAAPAAAAAAPLVTPGRVDPPQGPARGVGTTHAALVAAWGEPTRDADETGIATWGDLEVTLPSPGRRAELFVVRGRRWRTGAGARVGMREGALRRLYGARLAAVEDRRGLFGVDRHWMVRSGPMAVGFVMRAPGRVHWIITGRADTVRRELRFAGPV